jgi:hypothetical protein
MPFERLKSETKVVTFFCRGSKETFCQQTKAMSNFSNFIFLSDIDKQPEFKKE